MGMAQTDDLLKTPDVARLLGVNAETVRLWVKQNRIKHLILPSGHARFYRADIDAILEAKPVVQRRTEAAS